MDTSGPTVYYYIVALVHGLDISGPKIRGVVLHRSAPVCCCSTSSLAQLGPTIHNTGRLDQDTLTNSQRYPHKFSIAVSTEVFWFQLLHFSFSFLLTYSDIHTPYYVLNTNSYSFHWEIGPGSPQILGLLWFSCSISQAMLFTKTHKFIFIRLKDQLLICTV